MMEQSLSYSQCVSLCMDAMERCDYADTKYYGSLVLQYMDEMIATEKQIAQNAMLNSDFTTARTHNEQALKFKNNRDNFENTINKFISMIPTLRCPSCGSAMKHIGERKGGFSGGKAVAGAIIAGPLGIAAGAMGKKINCYQCPCCGYTLEK
ncbi:MAG: hypothetical protein IIX36_01550 [Clostridia bacterium]|nr:hypothetical protein [Clostridia bacterium]